MFIILSIILSIICLTLYNIIFNKTSKKNIIKSLLTIIISIILYLAIIKDQTLTFKNLLYSSLITNIINTIMNLKNKPEGPMKYLKLFLTVLSLITIVELGVFNYRHFESISYQEKTITNFVIDDNFKKLDDNVLEASKTGTYTLIFKNINSKVNNIYVNLGERYITGNFYAIDESNQKYIKLPQTIVSQSYERSMYHRFHLSGKVKKIKFVFNLEIGDQIALKEVKVNTNVPLFISLTRIFVLSIIIFILILIRPTSSLYKYKAINNKVTVVLSTIILTAIISLIVNITLLNPIMRNIPRIQSKEYQELAISLADKKLELNIPVSDTLKNMNNPYDTKYRKQLIKENSDTEYWDYAYYNGKYYVYFGVIPVVTSYLPYYLATGQNLPNFFDNMFFCILTSIFIFVLIYELIKRYFKKTPLIIYLLLSTFTCFASRIIFIVTRPDLYSVPISYSLFLTLLGLTLWIKALPNEKRKTMNKPCAFFGSLSMALVAGCRPQFLISSFFILPLYWQYIMDKPDIKSKIKELFVLLFPYVLVAVPLMWYNYARFGSITDFGANYNLTTNDMTRRGFVFERTFLGIWQYLFSITRFKNIFPFIELTKVDTTYQGITIAEAFAGGFIFNNLLTILSLFVFKFKKYINDKKIYQIAVLCPIFAILVIILDTQMAGILPRYIADFAYLLLLSTNIIILSIANSNEKLFKEPRIRNVLLKIMITLIVLSIGYNLLMVFVNTSWKLNQFNPFSYYKYYYLLQWWI